MDSGVTATLQELECLFSGGAIFEESTVDDRYRYKKVAGSADSKNTYDEFD